jgi:hypothetical protein
LGACTRWAPTSISLKDLDLASELMGELEQTRGISAALTRLLAAGNGLPRPAVEDVIAALRVAGGEKPSGLSAQRRMVLEVLPELGEGFVDACLQHMDLSSEKVVNALLTGELPPELDKLDRKTGRAVAAVPVASVAVAAPVVSSGKGKEEADDDVVPVVAQRSPEPMTSCLMEEIEEERSVAGRVRQGKKELDGEEEPDEELRAQTARYGAEALYDDEYDDSFAVHASLGMDKLNVDEAEVKVQGRAAAAADGDLEQIAQPTAAPAVTGRGRGRGRGGGAGGSGGGKSNRNKRKDLSMKKTGMAAKN